MTVQSPITLTVTNRIVRCRVFNHALIINQSTKATVWVSGNAGMSPGQGTVINPGTFVNWTQPGDIFLILGTDVKSTDATVATVVVSYDISNWAPDPVAIAASALNRQATLGNFTFSAANGPVLTQLNKALMTPGMPVVAAAVIDASLYSCLNIAAQFDTSQQCGFSVLFYNSLSDAISSVSSAILWQHDFMNYAVSSGGTLGVLRCQIPVRAPYIRIVSSAGPANGPFLNLAIALNSYVIPEIRYDLPAFGNVKGTGCLLSANGVNLANATATANLYTEPLYGGEVDIYIEADFGVILAVNAYGGVVDMFTNNTVAVANRIFTGELVGTPGSAITGVTTRGFRISIPSEQILVRMVNQSGGIINSWAIHMFAASYPN